MFFLSDEDNDDYSSLATTTTNALPDDVGWSGEPPQSNLGASGGVLPPQMILGLVIQAQLQNK